MRAHTHTKRQTQSERQSKKAAAAAAWGMCATTNSRTKIQTSRIHIQRVAPSLSNVLLVALLAVLRSFVYIHKVEDAPSQAYP